MISARRYRPTNSRFFTWILRHTLGAWAHRAYGARAEGLEIVERIKPPFILVGNHSTLLDPFIMNYYVPHPVHWVASDGNMRSALMRFLLIKLVGSIPKSKSIPDIETVNWIVEIIRKKKGVVGFYPEGQSSWNGANVPAFGSTAKLLKLLKAPVICVRSRGAYMTMPRWAYKRRSGQTLLEFSQLFSPESLKSMSVEEIDEALNKAISQNDPEWALENNIDYRSPVRAECLELALYSCPACGDFHCLSSSGSTLRCESCGAEVEYGEDGLFHAKAEGSEPRLRDIGSWDAWQEAHLGKELKSRLDSADIRPIFADSYVSLLSGSRMDDMKLLGRGTISLNVDRLEFSGAGGRPIRFEVGEIEGPGVLKWNFFEFYVGKTVYRVKFRDRAASGRKYAVALELLKRIRADYPGLAPITSA
jgi:1-acyl-sn-glycerol-3-phosphate acyltransferase